MSHFKERAKQTGGTQRLTDGGLGKLCDFSAKNSHFNAIWIKLRTFIEPFERTKLLKSEVINKN